MEVCLANELKGTIIIADEGINATISGEREKINNLMEFLRSDDRLSDLQNKNSFASFKPFEKMKIRLKNETIRIDINEVNPLQQSGIHLTP